MEKEWKLIIFKSMASKIRGKKYSCLNFKIISFLFLFNLTSNSEIHLIIKGYGTQNLVSGEFSLANEPYEILVNGVLNPGCTKLVN